MDCGSAPWRNDDPGRFGAENGKQEKLRTVSFFTIANCAEEARWRKHFTAHIVE